MPLYPQHHGFLEPDPQKFVDSQVNWLQTYWDKKSPLFFYFYSLDDLAALETS